MKSSFIVPADAVPPTRHERAAAPGEQIRPHNPTCFGCGPESPTGLHMTAVAGDRIDCSATFTVEPKFEGGPGVIHGGILSTAFDEAMGLCLKLMRVIAVTAHLEIDFAKPILLGTELRFESEVLGQVGRKLYSQSIAYSGDVEVARAHALFITVQPERHFKDSYALSQRADHYEQRVEMDDIQAP
ncbi:PaaI family thioesterase [Jongsikchunia kroppenstedtii]|uniref:PaaI family thioesterase n=1 Tax=Jongsikchunia kroppenstedtii TaxID=1121721 RepID=UPI00037F0058|nr:PaaI family thioesterase [Jongsikchunia kroppenstedtii]